MAKLLGEALLITNTYLFRVVRASVCPSVDQFVSLFDACLILWTMHARVLKFHIWILYEKWLIRICFLVQVISLSWVMFIWKNKYELLSARYLAKYLAKELGTWSADRRWCVDNRINLWTNSVNFLGAMTLWIFGHFKHVSNIWARSLNLGQLIGDDKRKTWLFFF